MIIISLMRLINHPQMSTGFFHIKRFTLQTIFLRPSVFGLHNADSNPRFYTVKKNVSIKRHKKVFGVTFLSTFRNFFYDKKLTSPFPFRFLYNLKPDKTNASPRSYDPVEQNLFFVPQNIFLQDT